MNDGSREYNTALCKGQGMLPETLRLLQVWEPGMTATKLADKVRSEGLIPKATAQRVSDIGNRAFAPRYLRNGGQPAVWLRILVQRGMGVDRLNQLFLLYTAREHLILYNFIREVYWPRYSANAQFLFREDSVNFIKSAQATGRIKTRWTEGKTWKQIQNQPLVVNRFASRLAHEFYPEVFPDATAFQKLRVDEAEKENERVAEMLELVRRRSGKDNIVFILDEVGQYIAARDNLILNLDGLAKNVKNLGGGKVWLVATAQQTLTEDDPNARFNSAKLFKLADRFPIRVDLEASDIREICYNRLLTKSPDGDKTLTGLFDAHGLALKHHTQLTGTRYYRSALEKDEFRKLYPFLPQHFHILLELLGRLAKTSGGIGLRSAIKVIQDVLVDQSGLRSGQALLADAPAGELATTIMFYDTLRLDIQRSFKHVVEGVARAEKTFGPDSHEVKVAKTIAVLQVLDDFPTSRENVAALLHPRVDAPSQLESVKAAVARLTEEKAIHSRPACLHSHGQPGSAQPLLLAQPIQLQSNGAHERSRFGFLVQSLLPQNLPQIFSTVNSHARNCGVHFRVFLRATLRSTGDAVCKFSMTIICATPNSTFLNSTFRAERLAFICERTRSSIG